MPSHIPIKLPLQQCAEAMLDTHWRMVEKYPHLIAMVERMDSCNQNQMARDLMGSTMKTLQHAYRRCRGLFCAHCQEFRTAEKHGDISAAYHAARAEAPRLGTLLMTFTSRTFPLDETPAQVEHALARWQRLQNRKPFQYAINGYVRGLQLSVDHQAGLLQTHTSVVALIQNRHAVAHEGDWLDLWSTSGKGEQGVLSYFAEVSPCGRGNDVDVEPFFRKVGAVAIQPDHLCEVHEGNIVCDSQKLAILHHALRTRRLIYFGGLMNR